MPFTSMQNSFICEMFEGFLASTACFKSVGLRSGQSGLCHSRTLQPYFIFTDGLACSSAPPACINGGLAGGELVKSPVQTPPGFFQRFLRWNAVFSLCCACSLF